MKKSASVDLTAAAPARRALWVYLQRQWFGWALALLSVLLAATLQLQGLGLYHPLIDLALPFAQNAETQAGGLQLIGLILALIVGSVVLSNTLFYRAYALFAQLTQRLVGDIRADYQARLLQQGPGFFRRFGQSELLTIGAQDTETINTFFSQDFPILTSVISQLILALIFMFSQHAQLALGSVVLAALLYGLSAIFGPQLQNRSAQYNRHLTAANAALKENLTSVRDIQLFGQADHATHKFHHRLASMGRLLAFNLDLFYLNNALTHTLSMLGLAFVYGWGVQGVIGGNIEVGLLISFAAYFNQFIAAIRSLSSALIKIQTMRLALRRVLNLMAVPPSVPDKPGAVDPGPLRGHIRFEHVGFSYEPENPEAWQLEDINFEILPGEKAAFVGGSGSGKSTLFYLLMRFYDVTSGRITLDGYDIRDLPLAALRKHMGLVAQNVVLFHGTLADNIRFGRPSAELAEVQAAAEAGYVTEFLDKLDNGYQTILGEGGEGLSGGQKQRVSIARAALVNPKILILDEATSALDAESEGIVVRALDQLSAGHTTLAITHRLSTIRNADKIVVLDTNAFGHGIVRAIGHHDQLMESSPDYVALVGKARRKAIMMPIGPQYDTTSALPTVIGLAQAFNAPVYVLDFGPIESRSDEQKHYGVTVVPVRNITGFNLSHMVRVGHLVKTVTGEGLTATVIRPEDPAADWVENTVRAIHTHEISHLVATDNVMIPMERMRESIQKIQRKTAVEYILVNPITALE